MQHALPQPAHQAALPAPGHGTPEPPTSNRGGLLRKLGLVLLLLAAGAIAFWKLHSNKVQEADTAQKASAAANRAIPVTVAPVISRTVPIYVTALGTVTAYNTVTVKSRVDGQLLSVNVREGQQVRQGQVLAMIDPRPYEAVVAQAQGQLTKDQATAANATAEAGRYTALYSAGVISKESQQAQVTNSGQANGAIQADRAAIQAARVNVTYTRITSPINGVVGLRQVDAGNIVHASDANGLLVVTQLQPIAVIFTLPEDQLPTVLKRIHSGQKLVVEAYDRSETTHLASGTLLTVDNQIDTTTGTVKVKAIFENKDGSLFPNQFVNVRLILEQRANSLVVPAAALQTGNTGTFVYVTKPCPASGCPEPPGEGTGGGKGAGAGEHGTAGGGTAARGGDANAGGAPPRKLYYVDTRDVVVDLTEGAQVILKSGVEAGELLVIDGQEKLKRFSKVDPKQGGPARGVGDASSDGAGKAYSPGVGAATAKSSASAPTTPDTSPGTTPAGSNGATDGATHGALNGYADGSAPAGAPASALGGRHGRKPSGPATPSGGSPR